MSNMTPAQFAEANEGIEAEARANYLLCAPLEFSRPFRLKVQRIGSVWVTIIPEADNTDANRIIGLGLGEPVTEPILDEAVAAFQNTGCNNYSTQICPLVQPSRFPEWLAARGFTPGRNWAKVYRGNEPPPTFTTDLRLERIGKNQADEYASVVLSVLGLKAAYRPLVKGIIGEPGWQHYLAFTGEKPVSAAAIYFSGEVAWLGWASTLQAYRNLGGQSALLARRIEDGLALGCKWFVAETVEDTPERPNPSYKNMLRSGFKLAYLRKNYAHRLPASPIKKLRRTFFIAAYSLRFDCQRLMQQVKTD